MTKKNIRKKKKEKKSKEDSISLIYSERKETCFDCTNQIDNNFYFLNKKKREERGEKIRTRVLLIFTLYKLFIT